VASGLAALPGPRDLPRRSTRTVLVLFLFPENLKRTYCLCVHFSRPSRITLENIRVGPRQNGVFATSFGLCDKFDFVLFVFIFYTFRRHDDSVQRRGVGARYFRTPSTTIVSANITRGGFICFCFGEIDRTAKTVAVTLLSDTLRHTVNTVNTWHRGTLEKRTCVLNSFKSIEPIKCFAVIEKLKNRQTKFTRPSNRTVPSSLIARFGTE